MRNWQTLLLVEPASLLHSYLIFFCLHVLKAAIPNTCINPHSEGYLQWIVVIFEHNVLTK